MIEYYLQIRLVHIACVIASGTLFALRGALVLTGHTVGNHPAVRYLSYTIDIVLLTAALMLVAVLQLRPGNAPWLMVKLLLLPVYIVLGIFALRRARTQRGRALCFIAALLVFLYIASVARYHHPLGVFALLG
ncbi:MAG: SirB2 family protein [Steroidobacteraceae bacterium]